MNLPEVTNIQAKTQEPSVRSEGTHIFGKLFSGARSSATQCSFWVTDCVCFQLIEKEAGLFIKVCLIMESKCDMKFPLTTPFFVPCMASFQEDFTDPAPLTEAEWASFPRVCLCVFLFHWPNTSKLQVCVYFWSTLALVDDEHRFCPESEILKNFVILFLSTWVQVKQLHAQSTICDLLPIQWWVLLPASFSQDSGV